MHVEVEASRSRVEVADSGGFQGQASPLNDRSWPDGAVQSGERVPAASGEDSHASNKSPNSFMCHMLILKC